ncbi:hypothetical protein JHK87_047961 [Glycine soja]|nr:hypothetical protein JHK87_047961 [Glycine soja]
MGVNFLREWHWEALSVTRYLHGLKGSLQLFVFWNTERIREVVKAKKARPMRARPKKATWQLRNGGKRIKSFEELVQQAKSTDMKKFQFKLEILKNSPSEFNSPNEQGQLRK